MSSDGSPPMADDDDAIKPTTDLGSDDLPEGDEPELEGDDLFGDDGGDEEPQSPKQRQLDDEELDSGDDEGRDDRVGDGEEDAGEQHEDVNFNFMDSTLVKHGIPSPSDNEIYLLKVPQFLEIEPTLWREKGFEPPTTDHHSKAPPSSTFSAYNTALTTLRWRRGPSNHQEIQSNARILRWSDGSLTLQIANDPETQYEFDCNALAPPQRNPTKPTPTSIIDRRSRGPAAYNPTQDSFTYLAAPQVTASVLRVTNKVTTSLQVRPAETTADDALERLQASLAAVAHAKGADGVESGPIVLKEDPALARIRAEKLAREKERTARKMDAQNARERDRNMRILGRSGLGGARGGFTASGLEDDDGSGRARMNRPKPRRNRRDDYSDEEDYGRRKTKEDEYDEEDDFIAGSDEDLEGDGDDDDEDVDDGIVERRGDSPKRQRGNDADEDVDAEGEDDDGPNVSRGKRRRVVDDEEDEE